MKDEFYFVVIAFFLAVWLWMILKEFVRIFKLKKEKRGEHAQTLD